MLRIRQAVALLLIVLWTPAVSHCLIEDALGAGDACCSETSAPDHSDCADCISVEKGQCKTEALLLPSPVLLDLAHELFQIVVSSSADSAKVFALVGNPDDTPPVPPAELILQTRIAQPVRGPALIG